MLYGGYKEKDRHMFDEIPTGDLAGASHELHEIIIRIRQSHDYIAGETLEQFKSRTYRLGQGELQKRQRNRLTVRD